MAKVKLINGNTLTEKDYSDNHLDIKSTVRTYIKPKGTLVFETDFVVEMGAEEVGLLQQQHGLSSEYLVILASTVVKSGYTGRLTITLINLSDVQAEIYIGDAVAQLLILKSGSLQIES